MSSKTHWETIYQTKAPTQVSWYQIHPRLSLQFIERTQVDTAAQIIDVGGGASTLVDDLIETGFENITVLDISATALQVARQRLGNRAAQVTWLEADILQPSLRHHYYDIWHDRAVFHFLTRPQDRQHYIDNVLHSVKPGGHVIVATFASDGPTSCSGLDIVRYSPESLHEEFGADFLLEDSTSETHQTPFGTEQRFIYCYCRKD